jgi:hypothetical protein
MSPLGEPIYTEPKFLMPGCMAYAYLLNGAPVGVLVLREGELSTLIYCDGEGRKHEDKIMGDTLEQHMDLAGHRMSKLIASFLGERHPLADRKAANERPI